MSRLKKHMLIVILAILYILLAGLLLTNAPLTAMHIFSSPPPPEVGTIEGVVFRDANGNQIRDPGETGIGNVTVQLKQGATIIRTTQTNSAGEYTFSDVPLGSYTVVQIVPFGYQATTDTEVTVTLTYNGEVIEVDFGNRGIGGIEVTVFLDENLNQLRDPGEVGLAGVTVELLLGASPIDTGITDASGYYEFAPLFMDVYTVRVSDPPDHANTTPKEVAVSLTIPGQFDDVEFGYMGIGSVSGIVFDDRNANGVQDAGEPGIAGAKLVAQETSLLLAGYGLQSPATTVTTTSDANGFYEFDALWIGREYTIHRLPLDGYVDTSSPLVTVELNYPGQTETEDFGAQAQATIEGTVFNDLNKDGKRQDGEPGIGGVRVDLIGNTSATIYTLADGTYAFQNIPLGNYIVQKTEPVGFTNTTSNTVDVLLDTPTEEKVVDFGSFGLPGRIKGTVFEDMDGDGVQGPGEAGIPGVTIQLWQGGATISTTVTASDGAYTFTNVTPGPYTVQEIDPPGYTSTTPNQQSVSVPPGGTVIVNFGAQPMGMISGVVFNDRDGSGSRGAGEEGLPGITIELWHDGDVIITTTTSSTGYYSFTDQLPDNYMVKQIMPPGYINTTPTSVAVNLLAGSSATVNFGNQGIGLVSGVVFNDLNGDGVQGAAEPGISGVTIQLRQDGATISTTVTASDGAYTFTNVLAGNYTVHQVAIEGYVNTTPRNVAITIGAGGSAVASFGNQEVGTISGLAFHDLNGDGKHNAGEPGLADIPIELWQDGERIYTTTTDASGTYSFSGVEAGHYSVRSGLLAGFVRTTPDPVAASVAPGGSASASFGFQQMASVSGVVFNDLDGDGVRDAGEPGIGGVLVTLTNGTDTFTRVTASNGGYLFTNVAPGNYTVLAEAVPGFARTTAGSFVVSVAGAGSASANFGYQEVGTISGNVFNDLNGDGARNAGESGLGGIVISLFDGDTTITTTTTSNGNYSFSGLTPGDYTISAAPIPGFMRTTARSVDLTLLPGGSASVNFGYQEVGSIGGVVFNDLSGDGVQNAGEPGLGGVVVSLSNGLTTITTTTTGDGHYSFAGLAPDDYTVQAATPPGFVNTTPDSVDVLVLPGGSASASFGFQGQGTVSGVIFNDLNGNSVRDPGELGLSGVIVRLEGNDIFQTTTTGGNGNYSFSDVPAGNYIVRAIAPEGFIHTTPQRVNISMVPGSSAGASFGFQGQGTVSGVAFRDANASGSQDVGEPGIGGVVISLIGADETLTTTTLSNGNYSFSNVAEGNYVVASSIPGGYARTTAGSVPIVIAPNSSANVDFGFQGRGTVSGMVFNDRNGNGVRDAGEPGIGGVVVTLTSGNTLITTTTSGDGQYSFENRPEGNYTVSAEVPNYIHTTPGSVAVVILPGSSASANFGFQGRGLVSGVVFNDANGNGARDAGESGIGGVTITLNGNDTSITTTTAGDGSYSFRNVLAGNYTVEATSPEGFAPTTSVVQAVSVVAGGSAGADFGFRRQGTLSGVVFRDANGNGNRDAGEAGIGGLTVTIDGPWPQSTTTAADGSYSFAHLPPGSYTIYVTPPAGFVATTSNPVVVSLAAGGSAGANFGFQGQGTVSGVAFNDANGNGVRDPGEANIGGLVITLVPASGPVVTTTTTVGDGSYQFTNVAAGSYIVRSDDIPGFVRTTPSAVGISVAAGGSGSANFGYQEVGTVSGVVFRDTNSDGARNPGEPGIGGVVITLTTETHQTFTTTTAGDGSYSFRDVTEGNYTVSAGAIPGFIRTTQGTVNIAVSPGGSAHADFGYQQQGTISGVIFEDRNGNGVRDAGEPGIGGVVVTYEGGSTVTAGDGTYLFVNVEPGSYNVSAADIPGFARTTPNPMTVLVADGGSASASFGYQPARSISGVAFADRNGNGARDAGELGLSGVIITLEGPNGTQTQTTAGDGSYAFLRLSSGEYTITAADVTGFARTSPASVTRTLERNTSATANFGYQQDGTVSGVVFHDANGDGVQNSGETGIGGVTVKLYDVSTTKTLTDTAITALDGSYSFFDVPHSAYEVVETVPQGYNSTTPTTVAITLTTEHPSASVNFGNIPEAVISGVVFHDIDGSGTQSAGEPGIGGIVVTLWNADQTIFAQVQTVGNGSYLFNDVPEGTYTVRIDVPNRYHATTATRVNIPLDLGGSGTANFGIRFGSRIYLPLTTRNYSGPRNFRLLLPLVLNHYGTSQPETFPFQLGPEIAPRHVRSEDETFYSQSFRMPSNIPSTGRFFLSRSSSELRSVVVDDVFVLSAGGKEIFEYDFSEGFARPTRARVEIPRGIIEDLTGQTFTVIYRDRYGGLVSADEIWLVWVP